MYVLTTLGRGPSVVPMTTATAVPVHQLPTSCHVCGAPAAEATGRPACSHDWTNAEAFGEAAEHDRRVIAAGGPVYSSGARNAEANYVLDTRGE